MLRILAATLLTLLAVLTSQAALADSHDDDRIKQLALEAILENPEIITDDQNIRLVYREWPILGEHSTFAVGAALAAREQGKYEEFHWSLISLGRATKKTILQATTDLGMDIAKLQRDMTADEVTAHIELSMQLANAIDFTGTPAERQT